MGVVIGDAIRVDDRGQPEYVHQTGLLLLAGGPGREQLGSNCVAVDGVLDVGAGRLKHEHAGEVIVKAEGRPEERTSGLGIDAGDPLAIHQVLVPDGPHVLREQTGVPGIRLRDEVGVRRRDRRAGEEVGKQHVDHLLVESDTGADPLLQIVERHV